MTRAKYLEIVHNRFTMLLSTSSIKYETVRAFGAAGNYFAMIKSIETFCASGLLRLAACVFIIIVAGGYVNNNNPLVAFNNLLYYHINSGVYVWVMRKMKGFRAFLVWQTDKVTSPDH